MNCIWKIGLQIEKYPAQEQYIGYSHIIGNNLIKIFEMLQPITQIKASQKDIH